MVEGMNLSKDILAQKLDQIEVQPLDAFHMYLQGKEEVMNDISMSYRMSLVINGSGKITTSKGTYYVHKGDMVVVAPHTVTSTANSSESEPLEAYSARFTLAKNECVAGFVEMVGNRDVLVFHDILTDYYLGWIESVFNLVLREKPSAYFFTKALLIQALALIAYSAGSVTTNKVISRSKTKSSEAIVVRCSEYMAANPEKNITVEDLCRLCDVSQSYLYKSFMSVVGMSTKTFITKTKLKATEDALLMTDKSIADIAYENGFPNTYQFSNIFKKEHGVSPSLYRKNQKLL